jgi:hypothetical protein
MIDYEWAISLPTFVVVTPPIQVSVLPPAWKISEVGMADVDWLVCGCGTAFDILWMGCLPPLGFGPLEERPDR